MRRLSVTILVTILSLLLGMSLASAGGIDGNWDRDDGLGGVRIASCGDALCGDVIWLKNPNGPGHVGERVLFDMRASGAGTWAGQAHNPEDGRNYSGTLTLVGDRLTTSGCILGGLICKSLVLSRAR